MFTGPNIITDGLVLYLDVANTKSYPGSGTTWNDLSGNGNNGTLVNGPTFSSGNNGSIVFDGVNDYVGIPFSSLSQNLTISIWFNPTSLPPSTSNQIIYIQAEDGYTIRLYKNSNFQENHLSWLVYYDRVDTTVGAALPSFTYEPTRWTNTVMTIDENGQYRTHINGVLVSTENPISFVRWKLPTGNINISLSSTGFNGKVSTFSYYNRALTPEEILQNYNATKSRFNL